MSNTSSNFQLALTLLNTFGNGGGRQISTTSNFYTDYISNITGTFKFSVKNIIGQTGSVLLTYIKEYSYVGPTYITQHNIYGNQYLSMHEFFVVITTPDITYSGYYSQKSNTITTQTNSQGISNITSLTKTNSRSSQYGTITEL